VGRETKPPHLTYASLLASPFNVNTANHASLTSQKIQGNNFLREFESVGYGLHPYSLQIALLQYMKQGKMFSSQGLLGENVSGKVFT
jgi:hypothetical protein